MLLHRPDRELKRLTPRNKDELLFDDVLWVKRARQEHDAFADALAERGVEVLYLERLLAETLETAAARGEVLDATLAAAALGPAPGPAVREWLGERDAAELAEWLIGGMTCDELPFASARSPRQVAARRRLRARRRCRTTCSPATRPPGSTAACRERDGQAGPPARGDPPRGDLPPPPALRRRPRDLERRARRHRPSSRAATSS